MQPGAIGGYMEHHPEPPGQLVRLAEQPVRRAVAQLTAEGLVEPVRRRGTVVRQRPSRRRITGSRLVYRDELGYYFDQAAQGWRPVQTPSVSRGPVPYDVAALLGLEPGAEVVIRDRVMGDPATGQATQLATSYIPAVLPASYLFCPPPRPAPAASTTGSKTQGTARSGGPKPITSRMPGPRRGQVAAAAAGCPAAAHPALGRQPCRTGLEVNDTRVNAEAWEISYPIARHASTHRGRDASTHA